MSKRAIRKRRHRDDAKPETFKQRVKAGLALAAEKRAKQAA